MSDCQMSNDAQVVQETKLPGGCKKVLRTELSDGCQKLRESEVSHGYHDGEKFTESTKSAIDENCDGLTRMNDNDVITVIEGDVQDEQDGEPFTDVGGHKSKKETKLSNESDKRANLTNMQNVQQDAESTKKTQNEQKENKTHHTVYMSGRGGFNLAKEVAWKQAIPFKAAIRSLCKTVEKIDVKGKSIRTVCQNEQQKDKLLKTETILNKEVIVTLPWSITKQHTSKLNNETSETSAQARFDKGVISRVNISRTNVEIAEHTGAKWARRITKPVNGECVPTKAVILAFETDLPEVVQLELL